MTFEEDDSNWIDGYEVSDIVVKDLDLRQPLTIWTPLIRKSIWSSGTSGCTIVSIGTSNRSSPRLSIDYPIKPGLR